MTDYFNDYNSFIAAKDLPLPADTPYETPDYIRSKRSSRVTATSSRGDSPSPPPLPPDIPSAQDKVVEGRYVGDSDPRRINRALEASLVSRINKLDLELTSKNKLVENLEISLSAARDEVEELSQKLVASGKDVRVAKRQVQQMEKETLEVVEGLVKERDEARASTEDLKSKLDVAQKTTRRQDDDALRTQRIWESEKETWENERRQLERRIHVTESRLRTFVDEVAARQAAASEAQRVVVVGDADGAGILGDDSVFKDSGLGNESDTGSVPSVANSPHKHRRNLSSLSYSSRRSRVRGSSLVERNIGTPEPNLKNGYSLADELGIDEEDEYDVDDFEHADDELEYPEPADHVRRTLESRQDSVGSDPGVKALKVLGLASDNADSSTSDSAAESRKTSLDRSPLDRSPLLHRVLENTLAERPKVQYVDNGYQPSPPPSPDRQSDLAGERLLNGSSDEQTAMQNPAPFEDARDREIDAARLKAASPISPPETPVIGQEMWSENKPTQNKPSPTVAAPTYSTASTQTEAPVEHTRPRTPEMRTPPSNRLSSPSLVPSIAIHPPTSRPSTPKTYVLPPRTKNASTQANISQPWSFRHASMQTEEIRVDRRPIKLPPHLQPSYLLPSPVLPERSGEKARVGAAEKKGLVSKFSTSPPLSSASASPPALVHSQPEPPPQPQSHRQQDAKSRPERARSPSLPLDNGDKDTRYMPLRALPLPRPVLSPPLSQGGFFTGAAVSRSVKNGVSKSTETGSSDLVETDKEMDLSDNDTFTNDVEPKILAGTLPGIIKQHGRVGHVEPPKSVPEDKEISPERRTDTAGAAAAAPAPSIASSRANSQMRGKQPAAKSSSNSSQPRASKNLRSRSPSFGSMASSNLSANSNSAAAAAGAFPGQPPYPIPTRSSSRIIPNSYSEGSGSPTPYGGGGTYRSRRARERLESSNKLRKVQSAAAMREAGGSSSSSRRASPPKNRRRRHNPDLTPVQSMAIENLEEPIGLISAEEAAPADSPTFLPDSLLYGHGPGETNASSFVDSGAPPTTAGSSIANTQQRSSEPDPTNLVDAIATTMVGEWMWKYIRKRKSFGVGEDPAPLTTGDGSVNIAATAAAHRGGSRHKRWVWLSPYERCIMWDSKQPTSGSALLGKKGRRLAIQAVLDVLDETPLPRGGGAGGSELSSAATFNRSILILTPERALKFTAFSPRRHAFWITALSFLAESGRPLSQVLPVAAPPLPTQQPERSMLQAVPSIPSIDSVPIKRRREPAFGRLQVRDSVRLTRGRNKFSSASNTNSSTNGHAGSKTINNNNRISYLNPSAGAGGYEYADEEDDDDGAAFPSIPRLPITTGGNGNSNSNSSATRHNRKRSNTSPRLPTSTAAPATGSTNNGGLSSSSAFRSSSASGGLTFPLAFPPVLGRNAHAASSSTATAATSSNSNSFRNIVGGGGGGSAVHSATNSSSKSGSFLSSEYQPHPRNQIHHQHHHHHHQQQQQQQQQQQRNHSRTSSGSQQQQYQQYQNFSGHLSRNPTSREPASGSGAGTGTVRMEAFVDPNVRDGVLYVPAPPSHAPPPPPGTTTATAAGTSSANGAGRKGSVQAGRAAAVAGSGGGGAGVGRDDGGLGLSTDRLRLRLAGLDGDDAGFDPFRGF